LALLGDILGLHEDHSMYYSFLDLEKNRPVNPFFDQAYRENVINFYCRTSVFEAVKGVYEKEVAVFKEWILKKIETGDTNVLDTEKLIQKREQIFDEFKATPLKAFHNDRKPTYKIIAEKLFEIF